MNFKLQAWKYVTLGGLALIAVYFVLPNANSQNVEYAFLGTASVVFILIGVVVFLLVVELLNTAIEKLADRVSREIDPQIGRVKDMGSAAVGLMLLLAGATWLLALAERLGLF